MRTTGGLWSRLWRRRQGISWTLPAAAVRETAAHPLLRKLEQINAAIWNKTVHVNAAYP